LPIEGVSFLGYECGEADERSIKAEQEFCLSTEKRRGLVWNGKCLVFVGNKIDVVAFEAFPLLGT
jgi:hypothetical protein